MEIAARGAPPLRMIAMPMALGAYLIRRYRSGWGLFLVGAVTFIGSQIFHIPFNAYVLNPLLASAGFGAETGPGLTLALAALLLGLSAGVFEEGARWLAYRFWIRRARTWPQGLAFGSGGGDRLAGLPATPWRALVPGCDRLARGGRRRGGLCRLHDRPLRRICDRD